MWFFAFNLLTLLNAACINYYKLSFGDIKQMEVTIERTASDRHQTQNCRGRFIGLAQEHGNNVHDFLEVTFCKTNQEWYRLYTQAHVMSWKVVSNGHRLLWGTKGLSELWEDKILNKTSVKMWGQSEMGSGLGRVRGIDIFSYVTSKRSWIWKI